MTKPDSSTVANAIYATWFDCNWEYHDALVDAHQSGDHERVASLMEARQKALQSRASGAVCNQPKRQRLLDDLPRSIERAIIDQVATALGLDNPPAKPRRQRQHTPRPPDGLHTASGAAAKLRCSIKTLNGHVAAGALKYVNIGHGTKRPRKMFTDADLNAFIEAQTRKAMPCPSTSTSVRRTINTTSSSEVIAFTALRRPGPGVKPKK
jgi:hypothetical protein